MPLQSGLHSGLLDGVLLISVYLVLLVTSESITLFSVLGTAVRADDRYGTQVNKALTSAMILWAICMSSPGAPHLHFHLSFTVPVRMTSTFAELISSDHLPILHYHVHPALIVRPPIKGIEVYRK